MFYDPELKIAEVYRELFLLNSDVLMEDRTNVSSIIHRNLRTYRTGSNRKCFHNVNSASRY